MKLKDRLAKGSGGRRPDKVVKDEPSEPPLVSFCPLDKDGI